MAMHDRPTDPASTHALGSHGTPAAVQDARTCAGVAAHDKIRTAPTLSDLRVAVAAEYDAAIRVLGHANTTIACGYLGISESVVRRLRSGDKPLNLGHLLLGPRAVLIRVLTRAAVRALGASDAMAFFAECMTLVAQEKTK